MLYLLLYRVLVGIGGRLFPLLLRATCSLFRLFSCFLNLLRSFYGIINFGRGLWIGFFQEPEEEQKYEYLGLILFVAIPLPFTGAWTGSLIAYLFDLKFSKSLLTIFIGVIIAASVMTFLFLTGQYIWFSFNG